MSNANRVNVDLTAVADEHSRLLHSIQDYDSAPAELIDTKALLESLQHDIRTREERLKQLVKKRVAEYKDIDDLRQSKTRRFFAYLKHGGKEGLARRLEKEEREYVEAAQAEFNETTAVKELKETAENTKAKEEELERKVEERKRLLEELDTLYSSAFNGPTPDFPEEDAAEAEVRRGEKIVEKTQSTLNIYQQVTEIVRKAITTTTHVENSLRSASRKGTLDNFGIGGIWAEMAERDHLMRAQALASQVEMLMKQARSISPYFSDLPLPNIVSPEWLNVVFDNFYTDMLFQGKMYDSLNSVQNFKEQITFRYRLLMNSVEDSEIKVKEAITFLRSRRRELIAVRREILTRVAEEASDAPPLYMRQPHPDSIPRIDAASSQLADMSISIWRDPQETPAPAYGIPSAPRDGAQDAQSAGQEMPPASPVTPTVSDGIEVVHYDQPPPGSPPGHADLELSASSSATPRSRSPSPHSRSRSGSARASPSPSPRAWDTPLPVSPTGNHSPTRNDSPYQLAGSSSRSSSPSPGNPRSPSSTAGTAQLLPNDVTPSMPFPQPLLNGLSETVPEEQASLGPNSSPWRFELLGSGEQNNDQTGHSSQSTVPPQMPSAHPFLDQPIAGEIAREPSGTQAEQASPAAMELFGTQRQNDLVDTPRRPIASNNPFRQSL